MASRPGACAYCGAPLDPVTDGDGRYCRSCEQAAMAEPRQEDGGSRARIVVTVGPRVQTLGPEPRPSGARRYILAGLAAIIVAGAGFGWWHGSRDAVPPASSPAAAAVPVMANVPSPSPTSTPALVPAMPTGTAAPSPTSAPAQPEAAFLLGSTQARAASLQTARFEFQRLVYGLQAAGKGRLQMPDRAEYAVAGEVPVADWLVVRRDLWTRRSAGDEWARGLDSVTLVNNPTTWLGLLKHAEGPVSLPPESIDGLPIYVVGFRVAPARAGEVDPILSRLEGSGRAYLRQQDGALVRLAYDLTFQALRGEPQQQEMRVSLDLSEWGAFHPAIVEPSPACGTPGAGPPDPSPAASGPAE